MQMSGRENTAGCKDATGLGHHTLLQGSSVCPSHLLNRLQGPAWSSRARRKQGGFLTSLDDLKMKGLAWEATELVSLAAST